MPRMTRVLHPALNTKAAVITTRLSPATLGDRKTEAGKAHMLHSILLNASMLQNWRLRILACRSSTRNSPNQNESRHRTCSLTSPGAGFFDASHVFFSDEIAKLRWSLRLPNIPRDTCMMKQAQSRTHTPSTMLLCSWPSSCLPNFDLSISSPHLHVSKRLRKVRSSLRTPLRGGGPRGKGRGRSRPGLVNTKLSSWLFSAHARITKLQSHPNTPKKTDIDTH